MSLTSTDSIPIDAGCGPPDGPNDPRGPNPLLILIVILTILALANFAYRL